MLLSINPQNPQLRADSKGRRRPARGGHRHLSDRHLLRNRLRPDESQRAIEKIYQLKRRDHTKPFSFICSDLTNISQYAKVSNYAYRTMRRLLPGPYTFILEGSRLVPKIMLTKRKTAGIRVPDNAICLSLVRELGNPIITTSATSVGRVEVVFDASLLHDQFRPPGWTS
jgi:tRNA threonylcarbamoyl adenosine modification protein (Sua5/YciO/YrdC/YwlC family)